MLFSYLNAALAVLTFLALGAGISLVLVLLAVAAYGIANDKRWGYWSAVVLSCLYLLAQVVYVVAGGSIGGLLNLLFAGLLVGLLLHPQSREYQRIWFR